MNCEMLEADTTISQYYYAKQNHRRIKYPHEVKCPRTTMSSQAPSIEEVEPILKKNTRQSRKIVEPELETSCDPVLPAINQSEEDVIKPFRIPKGKYQKIQQTRPIADSTETASAETASASPVMKISKKRKNREFYATSTAKNDLAVNRHVDHILNIMFDEHFETHPLNLFMNEHAESLLLNDEIQAAIAIYRKWWVTESTDVCEMMEQFLGTE